MQVLCVIKEDKRKQLVMGFYDAKGYWRNDGDGFYDAKGNWCNPGEGFYDAKGYFRNPGDGFYDTKGNWVNSGGSYYDGKGYLRTYSLTDVSTSGTGIVAAIGFVLFLPIGILWMMTTFLVQWITFHLYEIFIGYIILDAVISVIITKIKKHQGAKFVRSFIGSYVCILSFIYIVLLYAVPYVTINEGSFASFFEFTLVLAFAFGGIAVVQFFNYYHEKSVLEFILGIMFFAVVIILLKNGTKEMNTIESLTQMYNLESPTLFKVLFGFAI